MGEDNTTKVKYTFPELMDIFDNITFDEFCAFGQNVKSGFIEYDFKSHAEMTIFLMKVDLEGKRLIIENLEKFK